MHKKHKRIKEIILIGAPIYKVGDWCTFQKEGEIKKKTIIYIISISSHSLCETHLIEPNSI